MVKNKEKKALSSYAQFSSIAIQMLVIIGLGTFIGTKLDDKYPNEHKGFTITLSLISVLLAIFSVIRKIIANSKKEKNES